MSTSIGSLDTHSPSFRTFISGDYCWHLWGWNSLKVIVEMNWFFFFRRLVYFNFSYIYKIFSIFVHLNNLYQPYVSMYELIIVECPNAVWYILLLLIVFTLIHSQLTKPFPLFTSRDLKNSFLLLTMSTVVWLFSFCHHASTLLKYWPAGLDNTWQTVHNLDPKHLSWIMIYFILLRHKRTVWNPR